VLEGRSRDEDFAADLSQVLKGTAPELYKNPALFFANTHPTRGLSL
jgi:predicted AAA+ superfamily ATPase